MKPFQSGGIVPKVGAVKWPKCPEDECQADRWAAEQLTRRPLVERHCICRGEREWVVRRDGA